MSLLTVYELLPNLALIKLHALRNFKLLSVIAAMFAMVVHADAQEKKSTVNITTRCATMEHLEAFYDANPSARAQAQKNLSISGGSLQQGQAARLDAPVSIPVIVHVVLPNPDLITDADVNYFINRLNLDYSGLNPDSTNAGAAFTPLRGHSQISFCRARRTPAGLITNGIERRASATLSNANLAVDPIKRAAQGGLDAWNNLAYMNIWVGQDGSGIGILGYATFPGTASAADDGVFLNIQSFANNSCYTIPAYNLGRTGSHEVGHYLGLYHIWGDENACTGDDFRQLPGTCILPTGLFNPGGQGNTASDIGDTPNQAASTTNCPTGVTTDACATVAPGKMYQNYMDYTADACYSMFTKKQVSRMEWVIDNCRAGFKTSLGCSPPVGFPAIDAALTSVVSPGGSEYNPAISCTPVSYGTPTCAGVTLVPKVSVLNMGATTITSITATLTINGVVGAPMPFTVNLTTNQMATLTFPSYVPAIGVQTLVFNIVSVNGVPDTYTTNNSISTSFTISGTTPLPVVENFVTTTFPPPTLTIFNPNGNNTWVRNAAGNGNVGSAFINNFTNDFTGQIDDLRTLSLAFTPNNAQDSLVVSFDMAHRPYSLTSATFADTFRVLVSKDCGATFTTLKSYYNTSVPSIATGAVSTAGYTTPAAADWRNEKISIGGLTGSPVIVVFRNIAHFGNNLFLDNININRKPERDLTISRLIAPLANLCDTFLTPQVVVTNNGSAAITSFRVGYRLNAGAIVNQTFTQTIAAGASATVTLTYLPVITGSGNTFTVFTADPVGASGTGDQVLSNDTTIRTVNVFRTVQAPLVQGFETTPFPPAGWTLLNGGTTAHTWVRATGGVGNNSNSSAFIDNYNYNVIGEIDALQTPAVNMKDADSVFISFDLAHKAYPGAPDSFKVNVSTDCGNTFSVRYRSGGNGATANEFAAPTANDWITEHIDLPIASGNVVAQFENTNNYGNNIFLDNVNIRGLFKRDLQLRAISAFICPPTFTPNVTVANVGVDTIKGFKVSYTINGGAVSTTTITNVSIPKNGTININLTAATGLVAGTQYTIKAYTWDPITSAGTGDMAVANDTLTRAVTVVTASAAPLVQDFEASVFPPANWLRTNPDAGITWQRTTIAAKSSTASAYMNNYNYATNGAVDQLITPFVTFSNTIDSLALSFDVSATTYSYPGSTAVPLDTLEVLATADCGATYTSVYKKWGSQLQTIGDPNHSQTDEFIPNTSNLWRNEKIDLTTFAPRSSIILLFKNTSNFENNIYVDNVNVGTKTLPEKLKAQGFLIYPSPFSTSFTVQHYVAPTDLRSMGVYNSVGQMVVSRNFGTGGPASSVNVDMSHFANGMYTVVLYYATKTVTQKIIKGR